MKSAIIIFIYLILGSLTIIFFDGTAGAGDSIYHYLYAKEAPENPILYFDHWAKPLWVLIASPFAQLGFNGIKIMNLIAVAGTIFFTTKTAEKLRIKDGWITGLMILFCPLYYVLTFSGLTEPLFAFFLILATFLFLDKSYFWSILIISFLPYIRSEGLFFIGVFGFTLIWIRAWKFLPILVTGSLVYGIAGYPVHEDFLWVFNKVPYAKLSSTYGKGNSVFHFYNELLYVIGIPFYIFFWLGIIAWFRNTWKKGFDPSLTFLIYGGAISFITAHSIFWYFGIFNSMGLKRVLICIVPLLSIVGLYGINLLSEQLLNKFRRLGQIIKYTLLSYLILFPFTSNPAAIDFSKDLSPQTAEIVARQASQFVRTHYEEFRIVTADIHFCELLKKDCFDSEEKVFLNAYQLDHLKSNDVIIWENWFSTVEQGIGIDKLDHHPRLKRVKSFEQNSPNGRKVIYVVYEVSGS